MQRGRLSNPAVSDANSRNCTESRFPPGAPSFAELEHPPLRQGALLSFPYFGLNGRRGEWRLQWTKSAHERQQPGQPDGEEGGPMRGIIWGS
jgi:hypothetical protein